MEYFELDEFLYRAPKSTERHQRAPNTYTMYIHIFFIGIGMICEHRLTKNDDTIILLMSASLAVLTTATLYLIVQINICIIINLFQTKWKTPATT